MNNASGNICFRSALTAMGNGLGRKSATARSSAPMQNETVSPSKDGRDLKTGLSFALMRQRTKKAIAASSVSRPLSRLRPNWTSKGRGLCREKNEWVPETRRSAYL